MQHRAFVADEQPQELHQAGAVEAAGGAIGRRLNGDGVGHARDRQPLLETQVGAKHRTGGAPGRRMPEHANHP